MTETEAIGRPPWARVPVDSAIEYAAEAVQTVTPQMLPGPTPCSEWDLRTLVHHLNDALDVLAEGIDTRCIGLDSPNEGYMDRPGDPGATFAARARTLRQTQTSRGRSDRPITIGGHPLTTITFVGTLAIEIAVHGWDVSQASGQARPIPATLANSLLALCPLVVNNITRHPLFAPGIALPSQASPSDRLVALLGRVPMNQNRRNPT